MATLAWVSLYTNSYITRDSFITNLRTRFDEDDSSGGIISDAQLVQIINQGLIDIAHRTGLLLQYATVTLNGSITYNLPDDLLDIYSLFWIDSSGNGHLLKKSNEEDIYTDGLTTSSPPSSYIRHGNKEIKLYGDNSSGTLKMYGTKIPTLPSSGSDYIDLPKQYLEVLYTWCLWWAFTRRRVPDEMIFHRDMYFELCTAAKKSTEDYFGEGLTLYGKKSL